MVIVFFVFRRKVGCEKKKKVEKSQSLETRSSKENIVGHKEAYKRLFFLGSSMASEAFF